jgi:hypothetical protein
MKQIIRSFLGLMLITMLMVSCKNNTPKEAKYIPKEASLVLVVDPQQLQDKLQKGGISIDALVEKIFKSDSADTKDKAEFNEIRTNAGIDWNDKLFVFMINKANADNSQTNVFSVLGGLKDAAKLEAFLKKHEELKSKTIQKEKDYSYMITHDGSMLSWNDKQVIATCIHAMRNLCMTRWK